MTAPLHRPTFLLLLAALAFAACPILQASGPNAIQQENSLPGTPGWDDFSSSLTQDLISGFGSKISVNHGDSLDFYVTTTAASFTIDVYRTGYYQGIGARLVQSLGSFTGVHQAIPSPDPVTGIIACTSWTKTTTLQVPSTWVTGVYLAKLTTSAGDSSFIFFVVRDDAGSEDLVFQASVTTYQAYNVWGGVSLYDNQTDKSVYPYPHATKVSFDRPFNPGDSNGAGHYLFYEVYFVYWLESQGYNVAFTTDVDTDLGNTPLTNHKAFLSVGHDEYWSAGMRSNVQNAINAGVNVGFFSANTMYWQIRFEPNAAGVPNRVQVGYKDFATDTTPPGPDPEWGVNNAIVTTNWRDPTVNQPENAVIGVMYEQQTDNSYAYVVQDATSWVYNSTGFVNGSSVPGIVGYEYDKVWNNGFSPPGLTVLSSSPVHGCCGGFESTANSTIYAAASGARVFAGGTIQWSWGLANLESNTFANAGIQQTTANILNNFIGPTSDVTLSATALSFNGEILSTTSLAQTVTLTSNGTAPLNISNITISGSNPGDFAQTNNCPAQLAINLSCTITVTFTPTAVGSRSASVVLLDDAGNSPQQITLSGIGQATAAPLVNLTPASLNFGFQNVGTTSSQQPITLSNVGTAPLSISGINTTGADPGDFIETDNCPTGSTMLSVGASCTMSVVFSPTASQARTASLTVTDNAADSPESVSLSGSALVSTIFFKDGFETGDFSQWNLPSSDSTGQRTVQTAVVNSGVYAAAFTITSSSQYAYIYTALAAGPQSQTFTRFYFRLTNASNSGIVAVARDVNGNNAWELDYDGSGKALDFYFYSSSGTIYPITSANQVIAANTWYCIEIQDTQTSSGQAQAWLNGTSIGSVTADLSNANPFANLMLFDDAVGTFYFDDVVVANVYNGPIPPAPKVTVSPSSLTFAGQVINTTSAAQTITLTNKGTAALNVAGFSISGSNASDFTLDSSEFPLTLPVNASGTVTVTFTPSATGNRSASLVINDNDPTSPQVVALAGTGISSGPAVTLTPTSLTFGNQIIGTTSTAQSVVLTSSGTAPLSITNITVTGTNAADFTEGDNCPTGSNNLAVNATCTLNIAFAPTGNGIRAASVTIADNVSTSPQTIALTGTVSPSIISLSPTSGIVGTPVTIAGSNFGASGTVTFNGIPATPTSWTSTNIVAPVPSGAATGSVVVTVSGLASNGMLFTVTAAPPPTLASVSPNSGVRGTAVPVTLNGTNFVSGASVAVSGSGVTVSAVKLISSTELSATFTISSTAALGARNVTVTTAGGTTGAQTFTVLGPVLTSISPTTGPEGTSVPVTLTGSGLTNATSITVSGSGVASSGLTVVSDTTVTVTFTITASAGLTARTVSVTTTPGGTSNTVTFTIVAPPAPTLTSVSPSTGARGASVPVTLTGTSFTAAGTTVAVSGGGLTVSDVTVVNSTTLTATFTMTTTAALSVRNVTVKTPGGTSSAQTFTILGPTLVSVAPNPVAHGAGIALTLTGTNLAGATAVTVSSSGSTCTLTASSATTVNATCTLTAGSKTVKATTPIGTTNTVSLTVQ